MWTWEHLILKNSKKKTLFKGRDRTWYSWTWFLLRNFIGSRQQMFCCKRNIWGLPQILNDISAFSADRRASYSAMCLHASCLSWYHYTDVLHQKTKRNFFKVIFLTMSSESWICSKTNMVLKWVVNTAKNFLP